MVNKEITVKNDFPIFENNKKLVYLDNAATTQKPRQVIKAMTDFYENYNANVHRGVCSLSAKATEAYENSREKVASFINCGAGNLAFTKNATDSINLIANGLRNTISAKDNIVVSVMDHHSNFVPWQQLCNAKGAELRLVDINDDGSLDMDMLNKFVNSKTKMVALPHISNTLGTIADIKAASEIAHDKNALLLADGAQSAGHIKVDVKKLGCDFFALSAHKMLGPTGIGALCGNLDEVDPMTFGGGMIKIVGDDRTSWKEAPWKLEAGTPNIAGAIGFGAAADYLTKFGMDNLVKHEQELLAYANKKLAMNYITIYGNSVKKGGIISFNLNGIHAHDIASIADKYNICIRAGHHCCQPLMRRLGIQACARASFYLYNTKKDIDKLVEAINKAREVLK